MDYSEYVSALLMYKQIALEDVERLLLFRIMNSTDSGYKTTSYLKLRVQSTTYKNEQSRLKRLQELNLIKEIEGGFLRGTTYYRLTTNGLFYIFSNIMSYPPKLLIKYEDNIILRTLLYPYFETNTIKCCNASLYLAITQYLQQCCQTTLTAIDTITSFVSVQHNDKCVKKLAYDLRWHSKTLGFKLSIMYNEANMLMTGREVANDSAKVALYELENAMKTLLSKDERFMQLLSSVEKEFREGYKELMELKKER